jgi:cell division protein FtsB
MAIGREIKRRVKLAVPPLVLLAVAGYFGWSATQGDHGLQSYARQQDQLRLAQSELQKIDAEVGMWERRVAGLRTTRLDPDTLDERARAKLNLGDPAEVVVMYDPAKKLF